MLYVFLMLVATAALYYATRRHKERSEQLAEPRHVFARIGVQIICGDCSGESDPPIKTHMDRSGHCELCGGVSFILASNRGAHPRRLRLPIEPFEAKSPSRVYAFEPRASREARSRKLAG